MTDREIFKEELKKRGVFYKICNTGKLLRYGHEGKYFFEGIITDGGKRYCISILGKPQEFFIVFVDSIIHIEGKVKFNGIVQSVDGNSDSFIVFILVQKLDILGIQSLNIDNVRDKYIDQIIQHEINHLRTIDLLKPFTGETNLFVSEILADSLLIFENGTNDEFIRIKIYDIQSLINSLTDGDYYKDYLEVVKEILTSKNPLELAKVVLELFKGNEITVDNRLIIKSILIDKISEFSKA